jgi:GT2 family glycosyltransferase
METSEWGESGQESVLRACAERTAYPLRVVEVELAEPLASTTVGEPSEDAKYLGAVVVVRLHTFPLGFIHIAAARGEIEAAPLAEHIWQQLSSSIIGHCSMDGVPIPAGPSQLLAGLGDAGTLTCLAARRAILADPASVTVIIATRDRPDDLRQALRSVLDQCYPSYDVLVVDNASKTAATADLVKTLDDGAPRLRYVREDRAGLGWAHQRGLHEAAGDIVAFTDDDVLVDRHWLSGIVEGFAATDRVGCVTGLVLPRELETPTQVWYEQYGGFAKGFNRRVYDLGTNRPAEPLFPFTVGRLGAGASMAFRRTALEQAGGFNPSLGPGTPARGGEDIDAFFKILVSGQRLVYQPAAMAYHTHRRGYGALRAQLSSWGIGYTAFLTAAVLAQPGLALRAMSRLPTAVRYALQLRSQQHRVDPDAYPEVLTRPSYPAELRRAELATLLSGPLAYLHGTIRNRQFAR